MCRIILCAYVIRLSWQTLQLNSKASCCFAVKYIIMWFKAHFGLVFSASTLLLIRVVIPPPPSSYRTICEYLNTNLT